MSGCDVLPLSGGNGNRMQIVPWFNKKEWLETYHQAYSEDVGLQEKAYTRMCIWKIRYPNLPMGVECTMGMLHVRLCDRQTSTEDSATAAHYKDTDLQLLYSTAVMRFLNQLTTMSNCRDSMYKMAEAHKIPDWLINLRHEAAHGNSVPALYLLRQAADVILQWLRDEYWEVEAEIMRDFVKNSEEQKKPDNEKISQLLDLWVELKLNYWAGKKTIDNLPCPELRAQAMQLATQEGLGIKRLKEMDKRTDAQTNKKKKINEEECMIVEEHEEGEYTHKIKTAFEPLLRKLFAPVKGRTYKKSRYCECLVDSLVKHKGFCPDIDIDQLSEVEVLQVTSLLAELWKEVVTGLQAHSLLPALLKELMARDAEVPTAQMWLRLLCQLLSADPPPLPPGSESVCQLLAASLPGQVDPEVLVRRANLIHIEHQKPLELNPASVKEGDVLRGLAQRALESPTRFTNTYLYSLLGFWETPLRDETKEKLCALARIYNGRNALKTRPAKVYTLETLVEQGLSLSEPKDSQKEPRVKDSPWKLYSGDADWSRCPLGALPWG